MRSGVSRGNPPIWRGFQSGAFRVLDRRLSRADIDVSVGRCAGAESPDGRTVSKHQTRSG